MKRRHLVFRLVLTLVTAYLLFIGYEKLDNPTTPCDCYDGQRIVEVANRQTTAWDHRQECAHKFILETESYEDCRYWGSRCVEMLRENGIACEEEWCTTIDDIYEQTERTGWLLDQISNESVTPEQREAYNQELLDHIHAPNSTEMTESIEYFPSNYWRKYQCR